MTLDVPQPSPAHRAALALHGLPGDDRAWVLAALPGDQQMLLQSLLQELEELGIPREASLFDGIAGNRHEQAAAAADPLQALQGAGVQRLADLLAAEPPRIAAALLAGGPWPWREQLLCALPTALVQEVQRLARTVQPGAALQAAVMAEMAVALASSRGEEAPVSHWQVLRCRLAALGRGR